MNLRTQRELNYLFKNPPPDVKVLDLPTEATKSDSNLNSKSSSKSNINLLLAINGPEGSPYYGGTFNLIICIPESYPLIAPTANFITKIFHPNVSPANGDVCVDTLKKTWQPPKNNDPLDHGLINVINVIKCLLVYPNPESALNEDAGKTLLEDYKAFEERAKIYTTVYAKGATNVNDLENNNNNNNNNNTSNDLNSPSDAASNVSAKAKTVRKNCPKAKDIKKTLEYKKIKITMIITIYNYNK